MGDYNSSATIMPRQKLSRAKKGDKWGKQVIDQFEGIIYSDNYNGRSSRTKKQVNYDLFNGKLNDSDFEYVTNPFGAKKDEFPANLQHYDIISPKINLLLGEEMKRPFNYRVKAENPEAVSKLEDQRKEMLMEMMKTIFQAEATGQQPEQPPQTPEEIEDYLRYEYSDIREKTGQETLNYLKKEQHLDDKFHRGFKDALIAGEEIYWIGEINGEPVVRNVNPVDATIIMNPDTEYVEDAQAIIEERWMMTGAVIDEFFKSLSDKQIDEIETNNGANGGSSGSLNYNYSNFSIRSSDEYTKANRYYRSHDTDGTIKVVRCEWKSMRKIGFLTFIDEKGEQQMEIIDEMFKVPQGTQKNKDGKYEWEDENGMPMTLEWDWISEYWEGTKIGDDIYVDIQPKAKQRRSMDNPSICKSGYVGYIYNSRNSESISLVDRMKPYQYIYNILMYRLELAVAKSKGKALLMDIAQIPSAEGWDVDKWMYYLDSMNIAFINSHEEGKRGDKSNFNQFQSIDLTLGDYIQQTVVILDKIKEEVGELSGVSKQRQGQIATSELVGNTERAVTQSSHITEFWFYYHNEVKRRVLESLIDCAKSAWKDGKKINYIMDDMARVFFTIDPEEFDSTEYGVFVSNTSKDEMVLQSLKSLAQVALQQDKANLYDIATMMTSESIVDLKRKLEKAEVKRAEQQEAQADSQAKRDQEAIRMAQEMEQRKEDNNNARNTEDNNTKIEVALINADSKDQDRFHDADMNDNGIRDEIDMAKLDMQREKNQSDADIKKRQLDEAIRKNSQELSLKKEDLAIKKKQANKPATAK
jgi:hypothetical protein